MIKEKRKVSLFRVECSLFKIKLSLFMMQAVTTCCSLAAGLRGNGERMRKWRENEEMETEGK